MSEVFMLVEKKQSVFMKVLFILCLVLTIGAAIRMVLVHPIYMTIATLFGIFTWLIKTRYTEFEYSYFDGEIRFTRIKNKSKRKAIQLYNMDEAHILAPLGDRGLYSYENNSGIKVRNLTSGMKDAKVYGLVAKGSDGLELVKFEPDERFLDAICIKYAQKVKR